MQTADILAIARETIAKVPLCFVVTVGLGGEPNARVVRPGPLRPDWTIGFMTELYCRKVKEIQAARYFTMAFQHDEEQAYVSLLGRPQLIEDVNIKRAIWSKEADRFHPGGPNDPNVIIVRLNTERIEIYNSARGIQPEPAGLSSVVLVRSGSDWLQSVSSTKSAA